MHHVLRLNDRTIKAVDEIGEILKCSSRSDVFRRALALLMVASEAEKAGGHLELVIPGKDPVRIVLR